MPKHVKMADYKEKKRDEDAIDLEMEDGTVFRIDPPALWPDSVQEFVKTQDVLGIAKAVVGEDRYDDFVAAGGTAGLVSAIVGDELGITPGE